MSADNDRLLELIGKGDTLQTLDLLNGNTGEGGPRYAINRALYGAAGEEGDEVVRSAEQAHRAGLGDQSAGERAASLYNLGCFALQQDDVLEARLRFAEVLELDAEHLMARHNLAYAHELLAETDDAQREYEAVLARHPGSGLTRLNLAQLRMQEGDYETGIDELERMHDEDPHNLGLLLYLCRALLLRGGSQDLETVLRLLDESADGDRFVELLECRGYALYLQGELDAAELIFQQLLERNEDNLFALAGLIKVLGTRSDFKGLRPLAERYHALSPSDGTAALLADLAEV